MKNVAIINKELVIANIDNNLINIIIELCEVKSCYDCFFNKDKWFTLLQHLIKYDDVNKSFNNADKTKFYLYGTEWFDYFRVRRNQIVPYNLRQNDLLQSCVNFSPQLLFNYFVKYNSVRKHVKNRLDIIRNYPNVFLNVVLAQNLANIDDDLPKGWVDNLPKLNSYLDNYYLKYFSNNKFSEKITTTRTINNYVKKYGKLFFDILNCERVDLNDNEDVENKVFNYLRRNNKLIVEPIPLVENYIGGWKVHELVTNLFFIQESEFQNHCIGRGDFYINQVKGGNLRAFSFRKKVGDKEWRYTVTYSKSGNRWEVEQHNGFNNRDKSRLFDEYDLKCLEVNIERVKKELDKYQIKQGKEKFF
jgi:hypothetical protein